MLAKIVSFGHRHPDPPVPGPGIVVIDISHSFRNPWFDKTLRRKNGLDPAVQHDIEKTPNFLARYEHLKHQVLTPGTKTAFIGCKGGHHRSVYLAERLGKELGVEVEHRDLHKP